MAMTIVILKKKEIFYAKKYDTTFLPSLHEFIDRSGGEGG